MSNLAEHVNTGKIELRVNKQNMNYNSSKILFAIIRSLHSKATKYRVYCKYKPHIHAVDGIESWYCKCKAGSRTVGFSHKAPIIYYFAHGVYLNKLSNPSENLLSIFPVPDLNTDDDETEENIKQRQEKDYVRTSDTESSRSDESLDEDLNYSNSFFFFFFDSHS